MNNKVCWFEIYINKPERAIKFYENVFKLKLTKIIDSKIDIWKFPENKNEYGIGGALVKMPGFRSGGNSTIIYFSCKNCTTVLKRIVKYGGKIQLETMSIGKYGKIALGKDTEGNIIGLHSIK